jgi:hypothetical protein
MLSGSNIVAPAIEISNFDRCACRKKLRVRADFIPLDVLNTSTLYLKTLQGKDEATKLGEGQRPASSRVEGLCMQVAADHDYSAREEFITGECPSQTNL